MLGLVTTISIASIASIFALVAFSATTPYLPKRRRRDSHLLDYGRLRHHVKIT